MIGRGALGNPYIFKQLIDYFETGEYTPLSEKDRIELFLKFLEYAKHLRVVGLRRQASFFTKGMKNSAAMPRRPDTSDGWRTVDPLTISRPKT